ncbi:ArsR/SmtB family transcription factor [Salarchaeum japonicum]|uniref:ArsR family transcriptional regulator n=1 Tax=Salarchaeum japonicum TaxID=555573 RepID=A0AAV3SXQ0_9EURY|nr:ArsR family transcriptional regulator [Salarchaeum japonicum]
MDSGALLDLLGNANRRRILRLLAQKPCYVTEISEYIGVSPKAVIDHLRRLEDAGLVESHTDDRRRKYFHIARNLRLEVSVSPYEFGAKSAYPASTTLDLGRCTHLSIDLEIADEPEVSGLAAELRDLRELERELSMAQRWVQGRLADVQSDIADAATEDDDHLVPDVLAEIVDRPLDTRALADRVNAPPSVVESTLVRLRERGIVEEDGDGWRIAE